MRIAVGCALDRVDAAKAETDLKGEIFGADSTLKLVQYRAHTIKLQICCSFGFSCLTHGVQDARVNVFSSRNDSEVFAQRASQTEVEWLTTRVGDYTTSLLHQHSTGCMILPDVNGGSYAIRFRTYPDLLPVTRPRRHAQVHSAITSDERAILGLAVHPRWRARDAEHLRDLVVEGQLRVCFFNALEKVERVRSEGGDGEASGCRLVGSRQRVLECALSARRDEYATAGTIWVGRGCREVGATNDTEFYARVDDQRKTNSILLAPEETLGAVDGVEGPKA